jgi:peptidoglycan/LPS O-acetylase OafA/YrhL
MKSITPHALAPYFHRLDALRFVCFFLVFGYHSFYTQDPEISGHPAYLFVKKGVFGNGNLGVNFFFVLSGFLITYLLAIEKKQLNTLRIGAFYMRRILRIWPLFFFCVAFGFLVFPLLKTWFGLASQETAHWWSFALFVNNFDMLWHGAPDSSVLSVLWSIAVEEQFYLIWPLLLLLIPQKKWDLLFIAVVACSCAFRYFVPGYETEEMHTLSCMGDFAIGALASHALVKHTFDNYFSEARIVMPLLLFLSITVVVLFRFELLRQTTFSIVFERVVIGVLAAAWILHFCFANQYLFRWADIPILQRLGRISYGLYCLHFIGILITLQLTNYFSFNTALWHVLLVEFVLSFAVTWVLAELSYFFLEKPFLLLKNKFKQKATHPLK